MKIEKLNDYQIRCTLTKADLAARQLQLSELAYGTDKAKQLFRDMMQMASLKLGFEAENIPLMIEAVPINGDSIVLIITKVEDPEEIDTRFSRFAPSVLDDVRNAAVDTEVLDHTGNDNLDVYDSMEDAENSIEVSDAVKELIGRIRKEAESILEKNGGNVEVSVQEIKDRHEAKQAKNGNMQPICKTFMFDSIHEIVTPAKAVVDFFDGESILYKDNNEDELYLFLGMKDNRQTFNRACNILSEYGTITGLSNMHKRHFDEHLDVIIDSDAIGKLAQL